MAIDAKAHGALSRTGYENPVEKAALRDRILEAEQVMSTMPQVVIEPEHYFVPGAYIREITIPAGVMLTSKTHKTRHVSIMLTGNMSIPGPDGLKRIGAPRIEIGEAGSKRIGFAHEDSRWITIHLTNETDLDKIEAEQFENDGVFDFATGQVLPDAQIAIDRADYTRMLAERGISHEAVLARTEDPTDRKDVDLAPLGLEIKASPIEGDGVFCASDLPAGVTIGPARLGGMRTQLGRYANHSCKPNGFMARDGKGDIWLVTKADIRAGDEITVDHRQVLSVSGARVSGQKEDTLCLE
jgi:hypothetical protein